MKIMYSACPCCSSASIARVLTAKDHTVSQDYFDIWECSTCSIRFTQAVPDQDEIGKYYQSENYISHSDTKKGLINALYHTVRKFTLLRKRNLIKKYTGIGEGKILDIGCGSGAFLNTMRFSDWEITGLEPDESARKKAKEVYGLQIDPSEKLFQLEPKSYDAITMWHVLEHVHKLNDYLDQLKKLLKPGGKIFIAVPNYTSYDADKYGKDWAAYDVPRHLYHFSPKAMNGLLTRHGLQLTGMKPMWYDSFYVSMLSEKYRTGHSNVLRAVWNGYVSNWNAFWDKQKCSSIIYIIRS